MPVPVGCHYESRLTCQYLAAVHAVLHAPYKLALERLRSTGDFYDLKLRVLVAFAVQEDGSLAHAAVVRGSGSDAFDESALAAVRSAAPYPSPPAGLMVDGHAPVSWLLHGDDANGCGMWNARVQAQPAVAP